MKTLHNSKKLEFLLKNSERFPSKIEEYILVVLAADFFSLLFNLITVILNIVNMIHIFDCHVILATGHKQWFQYLNFQIEKLGAFIFLPM